jgi:hypothetical protein
MPSFQQIKKGIPEFFEQANIVQSKVGGEKKIKWLSSMMWCLLRYGARPIDYVRFEFYKKNGTERNKYLTIYRYFKLLKKFGTYESNVHGKIAEYQTFKDYIRRDWMILDQTTSQEDLMSFITKNKVVFAKPNHGDQGKGVLKIKSNDVDAINNLIELSKQQPYVVDGVVENDENISVINPSSLNTIRAYTLINKDGSVRILTIMLRVGKKGSHVDNWGSGGVGYDFDLDTGICVSYGRDKQNNPYTHHPGSNIQMIGYKLPRFEELKEIIVSLAQVTPKARYVGWDIALTPNGFELIEMNCPGGHDFLQAFGTPFYDVLKKELR